MVRSVQTTALLTSMILIAGCASAPHGTNDGGIFRESAADVTNRAPSSMSVNATANDGGAGPDPQAGLQSSAQNRTQADYHFALAESYSLEGDAARATEEYKLTLVYDPESASVRLRLAAEYVKQGLVSEAMNQAKAAVQRDPNSIDGHLLLGGLFSALRMYEDALGEYRKVTTIDADNTEAPLFIGALLAEQKRYAEAVNVFEKLAKNPNNSNAHVAWYYLGRVHLEQDRAKNGAKAETDFVQALAAKPGYTEAAVALGQLLESSGRRPKALAFYKAYQEKYGPSASIAEELSRMFIEDKDYARAYDQLAIMEAADTNDLNVKSKMAFILIEQSKFPEAIARLEEVLSLEPSSDKIRFYLGAVYEEVKDYRSAIAQFKKVPNASSYFPEAVVHTSYLYKLMGDYKNAIATIEQGIKAKDDHPPFYALYASLLDDTKEYKKALDMLTVATKRFPDQAQLYFFLGNMQDRLGQREETIASMKRVLEIDKDHVQALNFLAYTYADSGHNLDEAERLVRHASEIQPNDAYILDTLGWVLFKRGQAEDAIRTLEAAYKIQPNESVIAEHLGDAYYRQQMPEKARRLYLRAVETETNGANAEKIRVKLGAIDHQSQVYSSSSKTRQPASSGHSDSAVTK